MFRELLRKNQQISQEECIALLTNEKRGFLAVNGDDGFPYTTPMNHYYNHDDGCIYFHCGKSGHRMDAIKYSDKVSFTVVTFIVLFLLDSPYLSWDYTNPEWAVVGTFFHGFEWFFVRIAPLMFVGSLVGAVLTRKSN